MKPACQHPFDAIAAPEDPVPRYVPFSHAGHIVTCSPQIGRANRMKEVSDLSSEAGWNGAGVIVIDSSAGPNPIPSTEAGGPVRS